MKPFAAITLVLLLLVPIPGGCSSHSVKGIRIVFMEPDADAGTDPLPGFRAVSDLKRIAAFHSWMENHAARMAVELIRSAWSLSSAGAEPVFYIALTPGGNEAGLGFRLRQDTGWETHPDAAYIEVAPEDWAFTTTLLHETGHAVLMMLNGSRKIPVRTLASIPHSTAALTDRGTAFDEGFAIHLETLAAHTGTDPILEARYRHTRFLFGPSGKNQSEFFRQSLDLLTFAQTRTRYYDVRENAFAFAPAFQGPDYLRVQLEKSRDYATLRDADQLLQSEGFYATFFFSLLVRGNPAPAPEVIHDRQGRMLADLAEMFRRQAPAADTPYLLRFTEVMVKEHPGEAPAIADVLLDLSHGVFLDAAAAGLWRNHYLGALRLDMAERDNPAIARSREEWRARILENPEVLFTRLGPQIHSEVPALTIRLDEIGDAAPLVFDANTVEEGIMRLVPGITNEEVKAWADHRAERPFSDAADFRTRSGLHATTLAAIKTTDR